ncbi:hypothetical protein [Motilibacter deserti]|uniref:Uncharacterized protein n=1 Tax=Motilibacter deserti TaxID=2714956 RepID=A0ABX0GRV9_9ACTN|nr:hypothetical protein [Motilibacter deserti]NHC13225.1 hypothetical protein [Motilibacter deserti]
MRTEDQLREELRDLTPAFGLGATAEEIVVRGHRRRARKSASAVAAAVAVAAVVGVGAVRLGSLGDAAEAPAPGAAPAAPGGAEEAGPALSVTSGGQPLGEVVRTGEPLGAGERVLYVTPVDEPQLPDIEFGLQEGVLDAATGRITPGTFTNEFDGRADAPGFHAGQLVAEGSTWRLFGYYVGDAARVSVTVDGSPVEGRTARWSEDPSVVLWWASGPSGGAHPEVEGLTAYAADGEQLPAGHNEVGAG